MPSRVADATGLAAAVAEEDGDGLARVTADAEDRHPRGVAAITQLDDVAVAQAVLIGERRAAARPSASQVTFVSGFGQLLQPAVVGEAAVPHRGIRPEDDLEPAAGAGDAASESLPVPMVRRRRRLCRRGWGAAARRLRPSPAIASAPGRRGRRHERRGRSAVGDRRAADEAVVQRVLPELSAFVNGLPVGVAESSSRAARRTRASSSPSRCRAACVGLAGERAEHFVRRASFVERRDERLDDRDGAVVRARVAPRLERVRVRHVPVAEVAVSST